MLSRILEHYGCRVDLSSDGSAAVALYKKAMEEGRPYDLVITDLTVPGGMGGRETITELLKLDPKVNAVVSSGYSAEILDFRQFGFKAMINKPYTLEELGKMLKELL
jgi:CheY-like chemotaxis protein